MKKKLALAQLLLLLQFVNAVKIGISRINVDITSTTTTTTTTTTTQMPPSSTEPTTAADLVESFATTDITELEIESTSPTTTTTLKSTTTTTTTIKPNFTISIFPPRLRTTKSPKTTTTTSTTPPTAASTIATNTTVNNSKVANDDTNTMKALSSSGIYYCKCDLLLDACDLNCCCDRDCSVEALNVFDCNAPPIQKQLKSRLEDFQYQHGLPSCKVNDGWLCVFRTNTRKERQKSPEIDMDTNHYYKWPTPIWDTASEQHPEVNLHTYIYGDPLQFLNMKTMTLNKFDLPNTFQPPHCQIMETVKFLKPYKVNCLAPTLEVIQLSARNILNFIRNNKLLLKPINEASEPGYITSILSDFKLKICEKEICETMTPNNNTAVEQRLKFFYPAEITFTLLHNYTQLLGGLVEFSVTNSTPHNRALWQTYRLEYVYKNVTVKDISKELNETAFSAVPPVKLISGALGYTQGKPLIIARFIAYNRSAALSHTNQVLDYFHVNSTKSATNHTISLFTTHQRLCHHDAASANSINYGISVLKQCKLRFSNESSAEIPQKARNYTEICMRLQTRITTQLFAAVGVEFGEKKFPELYVSQLGRPENRSDKWTPLKVENQNFAPISGEFNTQTHSFSCRNMLLNIAYEFLVGHFTESGVAQQALVKHAKLIFGERNDLEFEIDEVIEVPLTVSVMFFDYSKDVYNAASSQQNAAKIVWIIMLMNSVILREIIN